jgi:hypothetical protein
MVGLENEKGKVKRPLIRRISSKKMWTFAPDTPYKGTDFS